MSDLAWPTAAELDANPALWDRWWWVSGAPERLGVDRMTYPARVTWRARFVDELPVEWFGGMVATAEEVAALRSSIEGGPRSVPSIRIAESEWPPDELPPHCIHAGYGGHQPWHGWQVEHRFSPEEHEIERLEKENAILAARVAKLETPGECASIHKLQAKLIEIGTQHDVHKERASALQRQLAEVVAKLEETKAERNGRITKTAHARAVRDAFFAGGGRYWAESLTRARLRGSAGVEALDKIETKPPDVRVRNYITALVQDLKKQKEEIARRIDPTDYAREVMDAYTMTANVVERWKEWLASSERKKVLDRVGTDVLADVESKAWRIPLPEGVL